MVIYSCITNSHTHIWLNCIMSALKTIPKTYFLFKIMTKRAAQLYRAVTKVSVKPQLGAGGLGESSTVSQEIQHSHPTPISHREVRTNLVESWIHHLLYRHRYPRPAVMGTRRECAGPGRKGTFYIQWPFDICWILKATLEILVVTSRWGQNEGTFQNARFLATLNVRMSHVYI